MKKKINNQKTKGENENGEKNKKGIVGASTWRRLRRRRRENNFNKVFVTVILRRRIIASLLVTGGFINLRRVAVLTDANVIPSNLLLLRLHI